MTYTRQLQRLERAMERAQECILRIHARPWNRTSHIREREQRRRLAQLERDYKALRGATTS